MAIHRQDAVGILAILLALAGIVVALYVPLAAWQESSGVPS